MNGSNVQITVESVQNNAELVKKALHSYGLDGGVSEVDLNSNLSINNRTASNFQISDDALNQSNLGDEVQLESEENIEESSIFDQEVPLASNEDVEVHLRKSSNNTEVRPSSLVHQQSLTDLIMLKDHEEESQEHDPNILVESLPSIAHENQIQSQENIANDSTFDIPLNDGQIDQVTEAMDNVSLNQERTNQEEVSLEDFVADDEFETYKRRREPSEYVHVQAIDSPLNNTLPNLDLNAFTEEIADLAPTKKLESKRQSLSELKMDLANNAIDSKKVAFVDSPEFSAFQRSDPSLNVLFPNVIDSELFSTIPLVRFTNVFNPDG
jgi:hypothetical protein